MKYYSTAKNLAGIMAGNLILALAVAGFILPKNLIAGGSTGIGIILHHFLGWEITTVITVFSVLAFAAGAAVLGKRFAVTTLLSTVIYPFFLNWFETIPVMQSLTEDTLLAALYAGVLSGLGVGLVFKMGASTGGMDIPPLIINKYFKVPIAVGMYTFDVAFLLIQAVFSSSEQILYGLVQVLLSAFVLNRVMLAGANRIQLFIISPDHEAIRQALLFKQDVGVTMVEIETAFKKEKQKAVMCITDRRKQHQITMLVQDIDDDAFIMVSQVNEVHGHGFTLERRKEPIENI